MDLNLKREIRKGILKVGKDDVARLANKYLLDPLQKGLSSKVVFGSDEVSKTELKDAGWVVQAPIEVLSNK